MRIPYQKELDKARHWMRLNGIQVRGEEHLAKRSTPDFREGHRDSLDYYTRLLQDMRIEQ